MGPWRWRPAEVGMSDDSLQFERAEYEQAAAATCGKCERALTASYFQVNGQVVCESCAHALRMEWTGGSRLGRAARAMGAGLGAAVLGSLLYYAVGALTGYEFGLIAIVVGFAVGWAVHWGSNGRGGWAYQTLAIVLTYLAIVSTYLPPIIEGLREGSEPQAVAASASSGPEAAAVEAPRSAAADEARPTAGQFVLAVSILLLIACVAPFLGGLQNIIGIVIIGIGLYEAWKLNRRRQFEITGPHRVVTAAPAA